MAKQDDNPKIIHDSLPQSLTPENLAQWILDNKDSELDHIIKTPLDEETVHELEKRSSLASRAIDNLEEIRKRFMDVLKEGTPDEDMPFDVTIPPTKGLKILKANRAFADKQLVQGHAEESIKLYMIPWHNMSIMAAVTIEGEEFSEFTRPMSHEEINKHIPSVKVKKSKAPKQLDFMDEADQKEEESADLDL